MVTKIFNSFFGDCLDNILRTVTVKYQIAEIGLRISNETARRKDSYQETRTVSQIAGVSNPQMNYFTDRFLAFLRMPGEKRSPVYTRRNPTNNPSHWECLRSAPAPHVYLQGFQKSPSVICFANFHDHSLPPSESGHETTEGGWNPNWIVKCGG